VQGVGNLARDLPPEQGHRQLGIADLEPAATRGDVARQVEFAGFRDKFRRRFRRWSGACDGNLAPGLAHGDTRPGSAEDQSKGKG
jgi:hypothetical protein